MRDMMTGVLACRRRAAEPRHGAESTAGAARDRDRQPAPPIDESRAIITRGEMPRLIADPDPARPVFQNLIDKR